MGVLCDAEMIRYNLFPIKSLEERMEMISKVPNVKE